MAGLGEACSDIAVILFTLDANVHAKKSCHICHIHYSWLPKSSRTVPLAPISDIAFPAPDMKDFKCPVLVGKMSQSIHLL